MTVLCGGAASGPKPGVAETIIFTAGALASLLNNKGGAWAMVAAPLLGVLTYQAEALCEADPPADPNLTSEDYLALLKLTDWPAVQTALAKLGDLAKIAIWYEMCECKTITTPAFPPGLLLPPAGATVQPVGPAAPCYTATRLYDIQHGSNRDSSKFFVDLFPPIAPSQLIAYPDRWDGSARFIPRPANWKKARISAYTLSPGHPSQLVHGFLLPWEMKNDAFGPFGSFNHFLEVARRDDMDDWSDTNVGPIWSLDPTFPYMSLQAFKDPTDAGLELMVQVTLEAWCEDTGTLPSPCGADPAVLALLQQILQLLTVVQRNGVPFAYAPHSEHAGLTGNGEVTVSETIAATITLTTLPVGYGMAEGHPDVVFDAGYIAFGNAEGFGPPQRIRTSPMFVRVPTDTTRIGYSLGPGIVATIKRHAAEP